MRVQKSDLRESIASIVGKIVRWASGGWASWVWLTSSASTASGTASTAGSGGGWVWKSGSPGPASGGGWSCWCRLGGFFWAVVWVGWVWLAGSPAATVTTTVTTTTAVHLDIAIFSETGWLSELLGWFTSKGLVLGADGWATETLNVVKARHHQSLLLVFLTLFRQN